MQSHSTLLSCSVKFCLPVPFFLVHTSLNRLWIHIESFNKGVQMTSSSLTVVKFRFVLRTTVRFAVLMVINLNTVHLQVLFGKWTKSLIQTIEMFPKFTNVSVWNYSGSYFFYFEIMTGLHNLLQIKLYYILKQMRVRFECGFLNKIDF